MPTESPESTAVREQVRVAVWGLGPHACKNVLPAIAACDSTRLIGVTTLIAETARLEAAKYNCKVWDTSDEMLASPEVDAVYLATPIGLHLAHGREVLTANKHLWCEKALTSGAAAANELATLSRSRKRSLCEAFMFLYHPQFSRIKDFVLRERSIGKVVSISCRFGLPPLENPGFRYSREQGGSARLDVACYNLSLTMHLLEEEPRVLCKRIQSAPGFEVDTSGFAVLEFPSGPIAHLEWGYERAYANEVLVWGERGSIRANRVFSKPADLAASIDFFDLHGAMHTELVQPANSFVNMLEVFAKSTTDPALQERLRHEAQRQAFHLDALGSP